MEGKEVSEYREIYPKRYREEESEEDNIYRDEHLIGYFHEEDIVEGEYDRHKCDYEEESEFHHLCVGTGKKKGLIDEKIPRE